MTSQCAVWDFRANEDYFTSDDMIKWLSGNAKKWIFQLEEGDSGYRHWQGRFSLIKKRTKSVLMQLFDKMKVPNYLEPTATTNHLDEYFYAMKEDTRVAGPYSDLKSKEDKMKENNGYIPRQYRDVICYPWQERVLQSGNEFDKRMINMIYDPVGNNGKSTVAAIGELLHNGIDMPPLNDFKELVALACCICMDKKWRNPSVIYIDMPRAIDKTRLGGMYTAIEQIKKGKLYDCRYHYKSWWIDSPQVWVFSNCLPDMNLLSLDRWKIWMINEHKVLVPYEENIEN